jgi:hypothetical protein
MSFDELKSLSSLYHQTNFIYLAESGDLVYWDVDGRCFYVER